MIKIALFLIAFLMFILSLPIAIFYVIFDGVSNLLFRVAVVIDMTGNVLGEEIFNDLLIKENGYKFGNRKETISSVLGKNQRDNTLSGVGVTLCNILDTIDKNHCMKSIDEMV